jgi:SPOR domain
MADRYQDRLFPADDDDHRGDDQHASARGESDPLAELARLIGQTDPFASMGRANQPVQRRGDLHDQYEPPQYAPPAAEDDTVTGEGGVSAGRPPWMQRVARQETPPQQDYPSQDYPSQDYPSQDYPSSVHPLHRYAAAHPAPEPDYHEAPPFADEADQQADPSRYDDALYGQLDLDAQETAHAQGYSDDPYAYHDGYADTAEQPIQKRRGGMVTVVVVLALAVLGTGAAFAYRTYVGSPRSGEPPIIKADTGPTKIVPAPVDPNAKVPDRMAAGDGTEKIVPREEAPVDVNAQPAPRMVPLNQNPNPPTVASVAPSGPPPVNAGNGTMPNNEPRKIRTLSVRGDQPDGATVPAAAPQASAAKPARGSASRNPRVPPAAANANASTANTPLSLSPQPGQQPPAADAPTRVANNTPVQTAPSGGGGGGYLVQVSSQKNEADAQSSYRVLQGKYPSVLGSQSVVVKRVDLGAKGVYYRAFAGPFGSSDQATQVCNNLKAAGGPVCLIQRN